MSDGINNPRPVSAQDVSWFLDLDKNKQLDLSPPYQRRSVWTLKDRQYFLDSILRNFPTTSIFLHKSYDEKTEKHIYHVVDGKQRLETVLLFANNKISISKEFGDESINGKKWKSLSKIKEIRNAFWNYKFVVEQIDNVETAYINNVFDRLNRNSRKLEAQEMRHAKYDGWFVNFVEKAAEMDDWATLNIVTTSRARRMKDVQFISELILIIIDGKIHGFDQEFLDRKYAEFDEPSNLVNLTPESISKEVDRVLKMMVLMENTNGCISKYGSTFNNAYTLWACLYLSEKPLTEKAIKAIADKYSIFMDSVEDLRKSSDTLTFESKSKDKFKQSALKYLENSRGASTDLTQRQGRLTELTSAIFG